MSERFTVEVTLDDDAVPADEDTRQLAERAASEAVADVLAENYVEIDHTGIQHTSAGFGHEYVQIPDRCPECGGMTEGVSPAYNDNGMLLSTQCVEQNECEWYGMNNYRLIDIEYPDGPSAVARGEIDPQYVSYPTAEEYDA